MRNFLWAYLKFKPTEERPTDKELRRRLSDKIHTAMSDTGLIPWLLRGNLSSSLASGIVGKNFIDLLVQ